VYRHPKGGQYRVLQVHEAEDTVFSTVLPGVGLSLAGVMAEAGV
jgi:hypothetical protein